MNVVHLVGNVGKAPDIKSLDSGGLVANFSVATRGYSKAKGKITEWHRCAAFGKTAEIVEQYVGKGSWVAIEGRLQTRSWEQDGQKRYMTEVIVNRLEFVGPKGDGESRRESDRDSERVPGHADDGEEIPF